MKITVSDLQIAYDVAMADPLFAMMIKDGQQVRKNYSGREYHLDDCGEGKEICRCCNNYSECLKRID